MGRNEDMQDARESIERTETYLKNLSDEDYAALHIAHQIKNLEADLKWKQEQLASLKETASKLKTPPNPPKDMDIWMENFNRTEWRWRGRRDKQEIAYAMRKGSLADSGW